MPELKERELVPAGAHTAVCITVADLGTQQGPYGSKRQLYISWELPDELRSDGKPFVVGKFYTLSSDPKATLRADIEGWEGRPLTKADFGKLDIGSRVGTTCILGIAHKSTDDASPPRAVIASVMRPPKGTPTRMSPPTGAVVLSLAQRPFDHAAYEALPEWLRAIVAKSPEYTVAINAQPPSASNQVQLQKALNVGAMPPAASAPSDTEVGDAIPF
jgi:hypothetical protein